MTVIHVARCDNPECHWFRRARRVHQPRVGKGLFIEAAVSCECGYQVDIRTLEDWDNGNQRSDVKEQDNDG